MRPRVPGKIDPRAIPSMPLIGNSYLDYWLSADTISSASDGMDIDTWTPRVGTAWTAAGTDRPIYHARMINDKPAIEFPGNTYFTFTSISVRSIFIVCWFVFDGNYRILMSKQDGAGNWICGPAAFAEGASSYWLNASTYMQGWYIGTAQYTLKNRAPAQWNIQTTGGIASDAFGMGPSADTDFKGYVAEIILMHGTTNADTKTAVTNYLCAKYGLSVLGPN